MYFQTHIRKFYFFRKLFKKIEKNSNNCQNSGKLVVNSVAVNFLLHRTENRRQPHVAERLQFICAARI